MIKNIFKKLNNGLEKTRNNLTDGISNVFNSFKKIDEELFEELEDALILADVGVETSTKIIESVKVKAKGITEVEELKEIFIREIVSILEKNESTFEIKEKTVILVIGVNGAGKTTSIGKLAHTYKKEGKKVLLAAADTFRAAAIDQLKMWGNKVSVDVISQMENSDPAAVVYDAISAAKARGTDVLICDTAGRLHNKKNLMEELKKINKIIDRDYPDAKKEVFLVLDANTGQNAISQARLFNETANLTGLILTKLDGTAKGGVIIGITDELDVPVRYIGLGEGIDDLEPFNSKDFANAIFNFKN